MSKRVIGLLVCAALFFGGLYYFSFLQQSRRPVSLAIDTARKSKAITDNLGGTNLRKTFVTGRIISGADYGNADLTIHIASPLRNGVLLEWAQKGLQGWHICSLVFRAEQSKQDVILVDDALTNCEKE